MKNNKKEIDAEVVSIDGKAAYPIDSIKSSTLVIHCGDPRFQTAFRRFINEELGIPTYARVVIGGGVHAFGIQSFLPKNFKILWEQIKFFVTVLKMDNIILINHQDCIWYEKMKGYYPTFEVPVKAKLDLKTAIKSILEDFGHVQIRSYWAALHDNHVTFEEIK